MTANYFGLHRTRKVHIKKETTFGTPVMPVAGDALKVRAFNIDYKRARSNRDDIRQSRSTLERITGKKSVSWNLSCYVCPSGVNSQPPDIGGDATDVGLLQGVFSSYTATQEGVYALQAGQAALPFFTVFHQTENIFGETLVSAWVEQWKLSGSGGDPPTMEFEGGAKDYGWAGTGLTTGAGSGSTSLVQLVSSTRAPEQDNFSPHAFVTVQDATFNDRVTAVTLGSTQTTLTLGTAGGHAWATAKEIRPASISETTAGSPISGVAGSFTIDPSQPTGGANPAAAAINVVNYEIMVKNNITAFDDEALVETVSDFVPGFREVSGNFTVKMRKDWVYLLGQRNNFRLLDVALVIGDQTNSILTVNMDRIECEFEGIDWQNDREAQMKFNFVALASSAGENEIDLAWT